MRAAAHNTDPAATAADDLAALLAEEEAAGWLDDVEATTSRTQGLRDLGDTADLPRTALPPKEPRKLARSARKGHAVADGGSAAREEAAPAPTVDADADTRPAALEDEELAPLPRAARTATPGGRRGRRVQRVTEAHEEAPTPTPSASADDALAQRSTIANRRPARTRRAGLATALGLGGASLVATAAIAVAAPRKEAPQSAPEIPGASIGGLGEQLKATTARLQADLEAKESADRQRAAAQQRRNRARAAARRRAKQAAARAAAGRAAAARRPAPAATPSAAPRPSVRVAPVAPRISQPRTTRPAPPACELGPC